MSFLIIIAVGFAYGWIMGSFGFGLRDKAWWIGYDIYVAAAMIVLWGT